MFISLTSRSLNLCIRSNEHQFWSFRSQEYIQIIFYLKRKSLYCIVVGSRRLMPRMHCSRRLIVQTLVFSLSYLHRQVSPPETLVVKGGTTRARNGQWILPENARLPRNIQGSFTCLKSTTWFKRLYFPSKGRRAEDFFRPEKSDGLGRVWTNELGYQRPARYL